MIYDTAIKVAAIAGFIAFVSVLAYFVPEWNLVTVLVIAVAMAIYDFFIRPRRLRAARNNHDTGDKPAEG